MYDAIGETGRPSNPFNPLGTEFHVKSLLKRLMQEEAGQDVIEYGLLAAGISILAIPSVPTIGTWVGDKFGKVVTEIAKIA